MRRLALILAIAAAALGLALPGSALAAAAPTEGVEVPMFPARSATVPPPAFSVDAKQAVAVAKTSPKLLALHRSFHPLTYQVYVWNRSHYEVFFFFGKKQLADVLVERNGALGPTYTGPLINGIYARGHYGDRFDSPWVFIPFGVMFLLSFIQVKRPRRLLHLDLAVLLSFGISYVLFNHGHLEPAVWLVYPPLLYLLARMLVIGWRGDPGPAPRDAGLPIAGLAIGLLALMGARAGLALAAPTVNDVGYASVIGAHHILHGQAIYYSGLGNPDTYGPIAYLAYVPFEAVFPWHGAWDYLASARAAAITFDVLTALALLALGIRLRPGRTGRRLGLLLAWGWAACPFTLLPLTLGTNDGLLALLLVCSLLLVTSPAGRGTMVGLATAAKFFPGLLVGLIAVGRGNAGRSEVVRSLVCFVVVLAGSVALFLPPGGIQEVYNHTIGFQLNRTDIFSIWALHPALAPLKVAVEVAAVGLALLVAFRPRGERSVGQVGALSAALIIAVQLPGLHWFYFYIDWFLPLVLVALLAPDRIPTKAAALAPVDRVDGKTVPARPSELVIAATAVVAVVATGCESPRDGRPGAADGVSPARAGASAPTTSRTLRAAPMNPGTAAASRLLRHLFPQGT